MRHYSAGRHLPWDATAQGDGAAAPEFTSSGGETGAAAPSFAPEIAESGRGRPLWRALFRFCGWLGNASWDYAVIVRLAAMKAILIRATAAVLNQFSANLVQNTFRIRGRGLLLDRIVSVFCAVIHCALQIVDKIQQIVVILCY